MRLTQGKQPQTQLKKHGRENKDNIICHISTTITLHTVLTTLSLLKVKTMGK